MKTVLALIGSPRKMGNCEIMAKAISRHIAEPHELKLLRLSDYKIGSCRGCYLCLLRGACVLRDDFSMVTEAILDADALIVTVPTYFLGPNAILKTVLDRGLALYGRAEDLWGKPAVGVAVAGIAGKEGYCQLGLESFLKMMLTEVKGTRVVHGALPGEVLLSDVAQTAARDLAVALLGSGVPSDGPHCNLCGGASIRFLGGDRVQCLLCSNVGTVALQDGLPRLRIENSEHDLFQTLDNVVAHREWLLGMKHRFKDKKDELKRIADDYRDDGRWVLPVADEPTD